MRRSAGGSGTGIALGRVNALNDLDIGGGHSDTVTAGDPVLGAGVAETSSSRGNLGNRVIRVCGAPLGVGVRDVRGQG